jgi:hypothetical protein
VTLQRGLHLSLQRRSRFARSRYAFSRISGLDQTDLIGIYKIDGLFFTESDTLRIAITEVAFEDLFIDGIKTHRAERTNANARTATDADIVVNGNPAQLLISREGLYRADIQAGCILTLLT